MQNPFEHSCWRRRRPGDKPVMEGGSDHTEPTYRAGYGEDTCPACAYQRGVAEVVKAAGVSHAAIEAGVVLLMRDVCAAVLQAHKESTGLDTLDEKITGQEEHLVNIMGMLTLRDANG